MSDALPVEDPVVERLIRDRRRARGYRTAARRAVTLARRYREEEGPNGPRERACIQQALSWRASARDLGGAAPHRPGLARTAPPEAGKRRETG